MGRSCLRKLTAEWVRKAEADITAARRLLAEKPPLYDPVCLHFQQCGEKYLKALLQEKSLPVPRSHDLDFLLAQLLPVCPGLSVLQRCAGRLNQYAVQYRYPGSHATGRHARSAGTSATLIRAMIRQELGLRQPRSRRT